MSAPNKYFDSPLPPPKHPRIRAWEAYRRRPEVDHLVVELRREREGLTFLPARLFVDFCQKDGSVVNQDAVRWEAELDEWLIDAQKARARDVANETLRFSLLLKARLRAASLRHGDGYFNSVLVSGLREGPFRAHAKAAEVLRLIRVSEPVGGGRDECQEAIDAELSWAAQKLLKLYDGDRALAEDLLGGAIALYLDERFSVTSRKALGFLGGRWRRTPRLPSAQPPPRPL